MELKDTVELMTSDDYRKRFVAEYQQTSIRAEKLETVIVKYEAGTLEFEPTCPVELLVTQLEQMNAYLRVLRVRAEIEGIELGA